MTNLVSNRNLKADEIEQTQKYRYLGHEIQIYWDIQTSEVTGRIGLGWPAFGKLRNTLKGMFTYLKRKVSNQCEAETLTLMKKSINKLQLAQRAMERLMLGITKSDIMPSTTIRNKTKVVNIVKHLTKSKRRWAGHVARSKDDQWTEWILEWRPREGRWTPPSRCMDKSSLILFTTLCTCSTSCLLRSGFKLTIGNYLFSF